MCCLIGLPIRFLDFCALFVMVMVMGVRFLHFVLSRFLLIIVTGYTRSKGAGLVDCDPDRSVAMPSHAKLKTLKSKGGSGSVTLFTTLRHYCTLLMKTLSREQLQQASIALQKVCDTGECCKSLGQLVFGDAKSNTMHMEWTLMGVAVLMRTKWLGARKGSKVTSITFDGNTVYPWRRFSLMNWFLNIMSGSLT